MVEEEIYSHKGKELFRNSYDYDLSGNTIQKTIDGIEENYTYDDLNRIKTITGDNQNITYYYDELGNVTQKDFGDFQDVFLYNNLNQVTRKSSKDGVTNYEYDNRGNLVKETTEGKVTSYEYNGFDNLTKIQNESGYQINRYDSFGNRVNILHNGREKNRILNGSSMIAENNNKGNQMNEFIRGYNLLSTTQESTSYYMSSHRGDVYDIVSGDGETVNKYRYDVYGKIEEETENIYNPYKYAGYEQNLVGATYNLGVRTYNPDIGRFIQEDTYLGDGFNLYAYVSGNPLKYVDPSGYCKEINPDNNDFKHNWNGVIAPTEYTYNSRKNEVSYMPIRGREREAYFQGKNLTKEEIMENIVVNAIKGKDAALGSIDAVSNELSFGLLKKYGITSEELVTYSDYYNVANELTEKGITAAELASIVGSAETIAKEAAKHGDDLIKLGSKVIRKNADDVVSTANKDLKFDMQLFGKGTKSDDVVNLSRKKAFRDAKKSSDIPLSTQYNKHKHVFDGTSENRWVYEFDVNGRKKYIIEHRNDKFGRGPHFHGADDLKGSPFDKGRYNQYPGHHPEDFNGFTK